MAFLDCNREDPFTKRVRKLYGANVIHAPRAGIDPLDVVARKDEHVEIRGELGPLVVGTEPLVLPPITNAVATDIAGINTAQVNGQLAARLLQGLGLPIPGASLDLSLWKGASRFSFDVRDVRERRIDIGALGQALRGCSIDPSHPAAAIFFANDGTEMHVISRTLVSHQVVVRGENEKGQAVDVSIDAIKDVFGAVNAKLEWKREATGVVSFRGARSVAFAFAAVRCHLADDGTFRALGLEVRDASYLNVPTEESRSFFMEAHLPLINRDGLLDVE